MPAPDLIVGVARSESGGFIVTDHAGRLHPAKDPADLGRVIAALFSDPELPLVSSQPLTGAMKIRNGAVEIAQGVLPPSLAPAAAPLVDALGKLAATWRDRPVKIKTRAPAPAGVRRVPVRPR